MRSSKGGAGFDDWSRHHEKVNFVLIAHLGGAIATLAGGVMLLAAGSIVVGIILTRAAALWFGWCLRRV
jgi:hypothetical protein